MFAVVHWAYFHFVGKYVNTITEVCGILFEMFKFHEICYTIKNMGVRKCTEIYFFVNEDEK